MNKGTVKKIVNSGYECSIAITGGGMGAINLLTKYGGASNFLVSAHVPYSKHSFNEFTGCNRQDDFVSLEACKELTEAASSQCIMHSNRSNPCKVIGVGVTAKLAYDGERTGRIHEAYIGILFGTGNDKYAYYNVEFLQTSYLLRTRTQQEACLSGIIVAIIARCLGSNKTKLCSRYLMENGFIVRTEEGKGL